VLSNQADVALNFMLLVWKT